jgi:YfiH family protein
VTAPNWIVPNWPAPPRVRAASTTRGGGVSAGTYASLNLGDHVGDDSEAVAHNRSLLTAALGLPNAPCWLRQVHGTRVCDLDADSNEGPPEADASVATTPGTVCAVLTADCLPVLLCDDAGTRVAVAHAGWRGLCAGVIEAAIATFSAPRERLLAWLGPAIGPRKFEVGNDVRDAFVSRDPDDARAFVAIAPGRFLANLETLARLRLRRAGVARIHGGGWCTFSEPERFYSYRRDHVTGRMASLIWIQPD